MIKLDVTASLAKLSFSPDGDEPRVLSVDLIADELAGAGVRYGILDDEIVKLVGRQPIRAVDGVVVARQLEPRAGKSAPIVRVLNDGQIAAAGDLIAELGEPVAPEDGRTVFGAAIQADVPPQTVLEKGANTRLVGVARLEAAIYGKVASGSGQIFVESPVSVSKDRLTAAMDIHPNSAAGTPITAEMVSESLRAADILYGVDDEGMRAALARAAEIDTVLPKQIVAVGRPSIRGEDARLEFFTQLEQAVGQTRDDGSVDFRERGTIRNLKAGAMICRRIPPTSGRTQVDVYGLTEFAEPGRDIVFAAGENVEKRDDEFWSTIDGAVMVRDNIVTVTDVYAVPGDIDLSVGNLRHEKGALRIKGTVRSGFKVYAATHIMVGQLVEDAALESGGDIEISGGVIHAQNGSVVARGNVTAKFAQNARIHAGGDIAINGAAINCDLYAGAQIVVAGSKARLAGGVAHASGSVHVEQLGSEMGAPTRVEIDLDRRAIEAAHSRIEQIEEAIAAGAASEAELESAMESLNALLGAADPSAAVIVKGCVYPGVTVTIRKTHHSFTEVSRHCRIWLDEHGEIQLSPLR